MVPLYLFSLLSLLSLIICYVFLYLSFSTCLPVKGGKLHKFELVFRFSTRKTGGKLHKCELVCQFSTRKNGGKFHKCELVFRFSTRKNGGKV